MKEVFVPVKGYEGRYEISNLRHVKSLSRTVHRNDGFTRRITERIIYSDKKTVAIGGKKTKSGKNAGNGMPVVNLLASSFYPEYSVKTHEIHSRVRKDKATLSDIMIAKRDKYNKVSVWNGEEIKTYDNIQEFCTEHRVGNSHNFMNILGQGWFKHVRYEKFDGWTFAFESPIRLAGGEF